VSGPLNNYTVEVKHVERVPIAVIRGRARRDNMSKVIRALFDEFYTDPPPGVVRGLNIVFYRHTGGKIAEKGVATEVGVQIAAPCQDHGKVVCSSTPAGEVATVTHWGDYSGLGKRTMRWARGRSRPGENSRVRSGKFTVTGTTIWRRCERTFINF
jgi:hypothetical protein